MVFAGAQTPAAPAQTALTVVDEVGAAVSGAQVVLEEPGQSQIRFTTDYAGHGTYLLKGTRPYLLRIAKTGIL